MQEQSSSKKPKSTTLPTKEQGDYYHTPEGYLVMTAQYHLKRGYCCGCGCRHCPWKKK